MSRSWGVALLIFRAFGALDRTAELNVESSMLMPCPTVLGMFKWQERCRVYRWEISSVAFKGTNWTFLLSGKRKCEERDGALMKCFRFEGFNLIDNPNFVRGQANGQR